MTMIDLDDALEILQALEDEALEAGKQQPGFRPYYDARANAFQQARHTLVKRFRP